MSPASRTTAAGEAGVRVFRLSGIALEPLPSVDLDALFDQVRSGPTVVDLSELFIAQPRAIAHFVARVAAEVGRDHRWCLVVTRPGARLILERLHLGRTVAIFGSLAEAVHAQRLEAQGRGPGWAARTPTSAVGPAIGR